ncbi:MAG: acyl-CoA thioesterase [Gammaproteobacteria bacterium]|nr:acyl-CoA thioesterase [Gammaproteobacteria bacterium]MBU1647471.1 acyl-CoA thioesterase [Gammaproteobacteria bacterium]MBU1972920.1 acyl-CoA thioesterase [Gammaproteobacteria bacterium]
MEHHRILVHTTQVPIRWGDMDAMGHVNNTVYFRYMEQARIAWLESLGYGVAVTLDESPVIVNASCTFIVPFTYPGTVEIRTFAGKPGRSSLPTWHEMSKVGEDTLYAEGASKIVWTLASTGKSAPLPEAIRKLVEALA